MKLSLRTPVLVQLIGGATTLIEYGGIRFLTDPTFDPPGSYDVGGRILTKLTTPALSSTEIGLIDVVLLSHDQHVDNLDRAGRQFLTSVSTVLSTRAAAARISETTALPNWEHMDLASPNNGKVRITGIPAQHGPDGSEALVGEVTGFMLQSQGLPNLYVSGDNASLTVVETIRKRFPIIEGAILFCGAAKTPLVKNQNLTLGSDQAVEATRILNATTVIPVHYEGWAHFTEGRDSLRKAFESTPIHERLRLLRPGEKFLFGN